MLKHQISHSIKKIIIDCSPQSPTNLKKINSPKKRLSKSIKLEKIMFRSFEPLDSQTNLKQSQKLVRSSQRKSKLNKAFKRYDYQHIPSNASKSKYQSESPSTQSPRTNFRIRSSLGDYQTHLSYEQMIMEREKQEDHRRLIVLKKVIRQNVKKTNQQMKIYSKKRMKSQI